MGSARLLQSLGFRALAHFAELVEATDVLVNADFEHGVAHDPPAVAVDVRAAACERLHAARCG